MNMYEFFRSVTSILFCDNFKTGILSHPDTETPKSVYKLFCAFLSHKLLKIRTASMDKKVSSTSDMHIKISGLTITKAFTIMQLSLRFVIQVLFEAYP